MLSRPINKYSIASSFYWECHMCGLKNSINKDTCGRCNHKYCNKCTGN